MTILPADEEADTSVRAGHGFRPDSASRPFGTHALPANLTRHYVTTALSEPGTSYGLQVLNAESRKLRTTPEGARNNALWATGCRIGELIGGGELEPYFAGTCLSQAAQSAGLSEDEIHRVLFRSEGALLTGISSPRGRNGYLHDLFRTALLDPSEFNDSLAFWHPLEWWFERLDDGQPSWRALEILVKIDELGILYRSNYMYLLSKLHELVLKREPGTRRIFETLDAVYRAQADEQELMYVELGINLSKIIANSLPGDMKSQARIIDFRAQLAEAS